MPAWSLYLLLTFLATLPFYLALRRKTETVDLDRAVRRQLWVPGLVALALLGYSGRGLAALDLGPGDRPWLLLAAFLLPIGLELISIFAAIRLNLAQLDRSLISVRDGWIRLSPSIRLILGHEKQTPLKFAVNLLATLAIAAALSLLFSLAEEIGWRGYLQDLLIDRFTVTWGLVLGGIFWGLWYAPLVLRGYRFPDYPRLGAFVFMPVFTIAAGIVIGWFYWLTGSLWAAAILNASIKVSAPISETVLGDAGTSRRVRIVWLWLWAALAGLVLTLWFAGS
ncbi:MAG TPA: CPBP family intramembrane glutamic endopeptidase [Anaerolineales bacterium]|nr:CPBP family intramembrane glutamic endopeptidase [Anaerolineales bacterium]